jgi:LacI family transcriptional regulator
MAQVALFVETALGSGRQILKGISRYVHEHGDWTVFHCTGPLGALDLRALENWTGDGIIARIHNREVWELLKSKQVPVVDVLGNCPDSNYPIAMCDNSAIAKLARDHFATKGLTRTAVIGLEGERWSLEREQAFVDFAVEDGDLDVPIYHLDHASKQQIPWTQYLGNLGTWLRAIPKPIGLFVCSDQFAPDLFAACDLCGLRIPEDVAMLGVDDDIAFCEVVRPSLSSVNPNHAEIGYQAARMLDVLMGGDSVSSELSRITPLGIEVRQSTDVFAVNDDSLKRAMVAIKEGATTGISVDEIATRCGLSRSVLQRRFKRELGRSVHDIIISVRINRAKELLTMTQLSLTDVAQKAGFNHQEYLGMVFKKYTGFSPARFRKQFSRI